MNKVSLIMEGWRNHLIPPPSMKEFISLVSEERLSICNVCPHNSKNKNPEAVFKTCTLCGCPLNTKSKALSGGCPDGRWAPVATQKEKEEMEEYFKNKQDQ